MSGPSSTYQTLKQLEKKNANPSDGYGIQAFWNKLPSMAQVGEWSKATLLQIYQFSGKTTWIVATSALVTIIPLILEVEREAIVIENEKLQIESLKSQGYTEAHLKNMGFHIEGDTLSSTN